MKNQNNRRFQKAVEEMENSIKAAKKTIQAHVEQTKQTEPTKSNEEKPSEEAVKPKSVEQKIVEVRREKSSISQLTEPIETIPRCTRSKSRSAMTAVVKPHEIDEVGRRTLHKTNSKVQSASSKTAEIIPPIENIRCTRSKSAIISVEAPQPTSVKRKVVKVGRVDTDSVALIGRSTRSRTKLARLNTEVVKPR